MHEEPQDSMRVAYVQMRYAPDALMYEYTPSLGRLQRVAVPIVYENLFTQLVGWSDGILAGRLFADNRVLASVTVGSQLFLLITAVAGLISVGAGSMTARRYGARQFVKAGEVLAQALTLSLIFGTTLALAVVFGAEWLVSAVRLSDEARPFAVDYVRIVGLCVPFILVQHAACACLRSCGQTWAAFRISLTAYLVTIGLSWAIAVGLSDDVRVGWLAIPIGTAVGFAASGLLALVWVSAGVGELRLPRGLPRPDRRRLRQILETGVPGGSIWVVINLGNLWAMSIIATTGDAALAAHGVVLRLEALCWVLGRALAAAAASLTGQAVGGDRPDLARGYGWMATGVGVVTMTLAGIALAFWARPLVAVFLSLKAQSETLTAASIAVTAMPLVAVEMPALAVTLVLTAALANGAGDTRVPLLYTLLGAVVVRVSLAYLFVGYFQLGLLGAWAAILADYYVRAAAAALQFLVGDWAVKKK